MSYLLKIISDILSVVLRLCYEITHNYGLSIIIFTLVTKFILFPVNIMIQKNAIKMVCMQPEIDALKIKYIDDKDKFVDEQLALYKKNHYHSWVGIIPLVFQLVIVLGLMDVIYKPLTYIFKLKDHGIAVLDSWLTGTLNITGSGKSSQIEIIHQIQLGKWTQSGDISEEIISAINQFQMNFLGLDLGMRPSFDGNYKLLLIPVLAGLSALFLCVMQNRISVMQMTAGKVNKYGTTLFMIAFSSYFAFLVPAGVGIYWIFGNLFSVPSMIIMNLVIPPKKYIDIDYLHKMQEQKRIKEEKYRKYHKKEREDYKRFFSVKNMKLMIYSESSGFYKYFAGMIDYICEHSDIQIHYVTSDPEDKIFSDTREQIHSYYSAQDKYLIPLFMKLECDMCIMTTPDLEKYHIKRSRVRKDIEYVYIPHGMGSAALLLRKGALDWYDTVFCTCIDVENEIREMESLYHTKHKRILEAGSILLDEMLEAYNPEVLQNEGKKKILIAPSWQPDNIIDLCVDDLLGQLEGRDYYVTLRPHPQMVRHYPEKFEILHERYDGTNIEIQTDFSVKSTVMEADILITDWSDIAFEYSFVTKKPVLFINTPMKVMNPDYTRIKTVPINIALRDVIGRSLEVSELDKVNSTIEEMILKRSEYEQIISRTLEEHIFNTGRSRAMCGKYVIRSLTKTK